MRVQFDWQAANEDGEWETIASTEARPMLKLRWQIGCIVIAALVAVAAGGRALVQHRYQTTLRRIAFQIQCAIDLEDRALAERDPALYLAQQDGASAHWLEQQALQFRLASLPSATAPDAPQGHRPKIQDVEMRGDVAWVQVISGQEPLRQVRFYRQTELGWQHTAPHVEFWQEPVELAYDSLIVRCHERDLPYIEPLVEHVLAVFADVCAMLDCPSDAGLEIDFVAENPGVRLPSAAGDTLTLPSPWLSGIPLDGVWDTAVFDELTDWVTHMVASEFALDDAYQKLNPVQEPPGPNTPPCCHSWNSRICGASCSEGRYR